jgi:CBS domain-containing protein
MKARDIMTTHPSVLTPDDTVARAAQLMRDRRIGMLPIIDNLRDLRLLGVLTDRDIVVRCTARGHDHACRVGDHMTRQDIATVDLDAGIGEIVARMEQRTVRRLPVLDAKARLTGIITLADLATRLRPAAPLLVEEVEMKVSGAHLHSPMPVPVPATAAH